MKFDIPSFFHTTIAPSSRPRHRLVDVPMPKSGPLLGGLAEKGRATLIVGPAKSNVHLRVVRDIEESPVIGNVVGVEQACRLRSIYEARGLGYEGLDWVTPRISSEGGAADLASELHTLVVSGDASTTIVFAPAMEKLFACWDFLPNDDFWSSLAEFTARGGTFVGVSRPCEASRKHQIEIASGEADRVLLAEQAGITDGRRHESIRSLTDNWKLARPRFSCAASGDIVNRYDSLAFAED